MDPPLSLVPFCESWRKRFDPSAACAPALDPLAQAILGSTVWIAPLAMSYTIASQCNPFLYLARKKSRKDGWWTTQHKHELWQRQSTAPVGHLRWNGEGR